MQPFTADETLIQHISDALLEVEQAQAQLQSSDTPLEPTAYQTALAHVNQLENILSPIEIAHGSNVTSVLLPPLKAVFTMLISDTSAAPTLLPLLENALKQLKDLLIDLKNNAPNQAWRLFSTYHALNQVCGKPSDSESDLFFPNLQVLPPKSLPYTNDLAPFAERARQLRNHYQTRLLRCLKAVDRERLETLAEPISLLSARLHGPDKGFWWVAAQFIRTIAEDTSKWISAKPLVSRIDSHLKRLVDGAIPDYAPLQRQLLYFIGAANSQDPDIHAVYDCFALGEWAAHGWFQAATDEPLATEANALANTLPQETDPVFLAPANAVEIESEPIAHTPASPSVEDIQSEAMDEISDMETANPFDALMSPMHTFDTPPLADPIAAIPDETQPVPIDQTPLLQEEGIEAAEPMAEQGESIDEAIPESELGLSLQAASLDSLEHSAEPVEATLVDEIPHELPEEALPSNAEPEPLPQEEPLANIESIAAIEEGADEIQANPFDSPPLVDSISTISDETQPVPIDQVREEEKIEAAESIAEHEEHIDEIVPEIELLPSHEASLIKPLIAEDPVASSESNLLDAISHALPEEAAEPLPSSQEEPIAPIEPIADKEEGIDETQAPPENYPIPPIHENTEDPLHIDASSPPVAEDEAAHGIELLHIAQTAAISLDHLPKVVAEPPVKAASIESPLPPRKRKSNVAKSTPRKDTVPSNLHPPSTFTAQFRLKLQQLDRYLPKVASEEAPVTKLTEILKQLYELAHTAGALTISELVHLLEDRLTHGPRPLDIAELILFGETLSELHRMHEQLRKHVSPSPAPDLIERLRDQFDMSRALASQAIHSLVTEATDGLMPIPPSTIKTQSAFPLIQGATLSDLQESNQALTSEIQSMHHSLNTLKEYIVTMCEHIQDTKPESTFRIESPQHAYPVPRSGL